MVPSGEAPLPVIVGASPAVVPYYPGTVTIAAPVSVQEGDLLLSVSWETNTSNPPPPSGWTQVTPEGGEQGVKASAKFASASEPSSYTGWYSSNSGGASIALVVIRGLRTQALLTPAVNTVGTMAFESAPNATAPSITPTAKSCLVYLGGAYSSGAFGPGVPGMQSALIGKSGAFGGACVAIDLASSPAGVATGTKTATCDGASRSRLLALTL